MDIDALVAIDVHVHIQNRVRRLSVSRPSRRCLTVPSVTYMTRDPNLFKRSSGITAAEKTLEGVMTDRVLNRMIGDQQPGATRVAFTVVKPYKATSPLLPSGLLGPVAVIRSDIN